jgi:trans-2,3-dihydro-3-hydroxyanthranilate isomerase
MTLGMTDYAIYDVFTGTALAGNPLAVVFDADDYSGDEDAGDRPRVQPVGDGVRAQAGKPRAHRPAADLHTVARASLCRPPDRGNGGCTGPPAAWARIPANGIDLVKMLEEEIGPVRCAVRLSPDKPGFAEFDLPRLSRNSMSRSMSEDIGAALGLDPHEIGFENHTLSLWSAGVPFVLVPVHDQAAAARPSVMPQWEPVAPMADGQLASAYVYCRGGPITRHLSCAHVRPRRRHRRGSGHRCRCGPVRRDPWL